MRGRPIKRDIIFTKLQLKYMEHIYRNPNSLVSLRDLAKIAGTHVSDTDVDLELHDNICELIDFEYIDSCGSGGSFHHYELTQKGLRVCKTHFGERDIPDEENSDS